MRLQIATFVLALVILVVDALTPAQVVIAWAYMLVILLAGQFLPARGIKLVTLGCIGLTVLGYFLYPPTDPVGTLTAVANRVLTVVALCVTSYLVLRPAAILTAMARVLPYIDS